MGFLSMGSLTARMCVFKISLCKVIRIGDSVINDGSRHSSFTGNTPMGGALATPSIMK